MGRGGGMAVVAAALALTGASAARADDCQPEGWAGAVRSPVTVTAGGAAVLVSSYEDETFGELGPGDGVAAYSLSASKARPVDLRGLSTSPSLAGDVVRWRADGDLVATPLSGGADRVLIAGLPFPGYAGVAAAAAGDGTITVVYGVPGPGGVGPAGIALRRIAPDGTVGPATTLPGVGDTVAPTVAVDAQGNAFAVVGGDRAGVAIRWPADGAPVATQDAALRAEATAVVPVGATAIVPDGAGGAWLVRDAGRVAHLTANGLEPSQSVAPRHRGERVEAVAVNAAGRATAVVARRGRALILRRGGRTLVLRTRRAYTQDDASVTVGAGGRAWVVWEESSDKLDSLCDLYPVHASVRWASVGPHARRATSRVLRGAPIEQTFAPG